MALDSELDDAQKAMRETAHNIGIYVSDAMQKLEKEFGPLSFSLDITSVDVTCFADRGRRHIYLAAISAAIDG